MSWQPKAQKIKKLCIFSGWDGNAAPEKEDGEIYPSLPIPRFNTQAASPPQKVPIQLKTEEVNPSQRKPEASSTRSMASPSKAELKKEEGMTPMDLIACPSSTIGRLLGKQTQSSSPKEERISPPAMAFRRPIFLQMGLHTKIPSAIGALPKA